MRSALQAVEVAVMVIYALDYLAVLLAAIFIGASGTWRRK